MLLRGVQYFEASIIRQFTCLNIVKIYITRTFSQIRQYLFVSGIRCLYYHHVIT